MKSILPIISIFLIFILVFPNVSAYYPDAMIAGPSGFIAKFNASIDEERNAGQWFEFTVLNVSGYADAKYHFTVYDAELKNDYEYRSESWGRWFTQEPDPGKKYLFVWIIGYSEGTTWYGWGHERFNVWYENAVIGPEETQLIDLEKVRRGTGRTDILPPRTIRFMENRTAYQDFIYSDDVYGFKDGIEMDRMEPGRSNAWNGYLIYQVPKKAEMKDLRVSGEFSCNGHVWWNLEPRYFVQKSPEYIELQMKEKTEKERVLGQRLRDNEKPRRKV